MLADVEKNYFFFFFQKQLENVIQDCLAVVFCLFGTSETSVPMSQHSLPDHLLQDAKTPFFQIYVDDREAFPIICIPQDWMEA